MWMNEWDIDDAARYFVVRRDEFPNLMRGAMVLHRLMVWTNNNSDGWPYWTKPGRASAKLQALVGDRRHRINGDITEQELRKALTPIKAFLTRQGINHSDIIEEN